MRERARKRSSVLRRALRALSGLVCLTTALSAAPTLSVQPSPSSVTRFSPSADTENPEPFTPTPRTSAAEQFAQFADAEASTIMPPARLANFQGGLSESGGATSLDSLNRRVEQLERAREAAARSPAAGFRGWQHDVFGRIQADTVTIGQSPSNIAQVGHAPNGTELERARLGVQGLGYDVYFYRFEADFAQPDPVTGQRPRILDAYAEIRELPFGTLRMGQFRVPLSVERVTSANDLTFIERGLPQAFNPARELGIMAMNATPNYFFSWYSDLSTQRATAEGEQFGKSGRLDFTQRIVFLPWYDEPSGGRYLAHLGGGYLYSNTRNSNVAYGSAPEAVLQYSNIVNVIPDFVSTGSILARDTQTLQAEASTVLGPLSFQAEYYGVFVDPTVNPAANNANLFFSGWYVFGSYFLTGENRVYNRTQAVYTSVTPFTNFFRVRGADRRILTGLGAWEVAVRFSHLNLSDRYVEGGSLSDVTFGLNWYLTRQLKVMANYILAVNDVHNRQTYADIFETRAQVVW